MNPFGIRQMMKTPGLKLGNYVAEFATPGIGHVLRGGGCDFAFFDMEHSGFGFETLKSAIRYFEAAELPVVVRVASSENDMLARACDMGAEGLMAPMISSAAQAKAMVDAVKYHPQGKRGVGLQMAHDNYRVSSVADVLAHANAKTSVFCMIETKEGAENADAIAAVDGVDCLWVGHLDLSASLGIPGEYDHPKYIGAISKVINAAQKHGKALGRLVPNIEQAVSFHNQGFDFICYSGDAWVLRDGLSAATKAIRDGVKAGTQ